MQGSGSAIWGYGDELVEAVSEILGDLGFCVLNMDAGLEQGAQRREDLRLTLETLPDWEAIVEVKGYGNGTKTNDARQIREIRERYREEKGRFPDLTIWLANPFREVRSVVSHAPWLPRGGSRRDHRRSSRLVN